MVVKKGWLFKSGTFRITPLAPPAVRVATIASILPLKPNPAGPETGVIASCVPPDKANASTSSLPTDSEKKLGCCPAASERTELVVGLLAILVKKGLKLPTP